MARARRHRTELEKAQTVMIRTLTALEGFELRIGLAPEEGAEPKLELKEGGTVTQTNHAINVATAARDNEFGTIRSDGAVIPARPAWRTTTRLRPLKRAVTEFEVELQAELKRAKGLREAKLLSLATALGQDLAALLAEQLDVGHPPPNAPRTIRDKGFDKPLEATGQTRNSISSQVFMRKKRKLRVFASGRTK